MASAIALSIFWASAILGTIWFFGGMALYRRYIPKERQRDERMLWFVVGPVGPMLFAYVGWEERHKVHGSILDAIFHKRSARGAEKD